MLVAYNVPGRDCGSYSAGGAAGVDAYLSWVGSFAAALGDRPAVVVLEPDAVPQALVGCPGVDPAARWLAERLGVELSDPALLALAMTHRSHGGPNNERLEYLGDAVLSFIVAEMLFRRFPEATEGELSRLRASLVSGEALAAAKRLGPRCGQASLRPGARCVVLRSGQMSGWTLHA